MINETDLYPIVRSTKNTPLPHRAGREGWGKGWGLYDTYFRTPDKVEALRPSDQPEEVVVTPLPTVRRLVEGLRLSGPPSLGQGLSVTRRVRHTTPPVP